MLKQLVIVAKKHGYGTIKLKVLKDNTPAIELYQSEGFHIALEEKGELLMVKEL